jgi:hypothetical protein
VIDLPGPWKDGEKPPGAADLNRLLRWAKSLAGLATGRLPGSKQAGGHGVGRPDMRPFWAVLSGGASPYSFSETDAAGSVIPAGRSGSVIEVNGVAGLGGERSLVRPNPLDYRTAFVRSGGGCPVRICVHAFSCTNEGHINVPIDDVTVTITRVSDSAVVCSGMVDASGKFCCEGLGPGEYSIAGTSTGHVADPSQPVTVTVECSADVGLKFWPPTYDFKVCLLGCCGPGYALTGASVSITATGGGGGSDSGTTDGTGCVTLTLPNPPPDSIAWTIGPPASPPGYAGTSGSSPPTPVLNAWGCSPSGVTVTLQTDEDHLCGCCNYPRPRVLHWTDGFGSCELHPYDANRNPLPGDSCERPFAWVGGYLFDCDSGGEPGPYGGCVYPVPVTSWALISVRCVAEGTPEVLSWRAQRLFPKSCGNPFDPVCTNYIMDSSGMTLDEAIHAQLSPVAVTHTVQHPVTCDPDAPINETFILGDSILGPPVCVPCAATTGVLTE